MYDGKVRDSGFKYQELQDKSGTETHMPRAMGTRVTQREAKKARAASTIVIAAAHKPAIRRRHRIALSHLL